MKARVQPSSRDTARAELEALTPIGEGARSIDTLQIPEGTLCYINARAGEVWLAQGSPQRRWLRDMDEDAKAATAR